ncbi:MAG: antibiotic biosynthesis monooxygenase family protein [Acidimicrobiia bacterium]
MIVRMFLSACAPQDMDEVIRLFQEDVVPAFEAYEDCLGIELIASVTPGVDGMIEGGAMTRWTSLEAMEEIVAKPDITASQVRLREYLRRTPLVKVYEVVS